MSNEQPTEILIPMSAVKPSPDFEPPVFRMVSWEESAATILGHEVVAGDIDTLSDDEMSRIMLGQADQAIALLGAIHGAAPSFFMGALQLLAEFQERDCKTCEETVTEVALVLLEATVTGSGWLTPEKMEILVGRPATTKETNGRAQ